MCFLRLVILPVILIKEQENKSLENTTSHCTDNEIEPQVQTPRFDSRTGGVAQIRSK